MTPLRVARRAAWEVVCRTRWRVHLYHRYEYAFPPGQLAALIRLLDDGLTASGCVVDYDGAFQAYNEFVEERGLAPEVVEGSMGILRRQ